MRFSLVYNTCAFNSSATAVFLGVPAFETEAGAYRCGKITVIFTIGEALFVYGNASPICVKTDPVCLGAPFCIKAPYLALKLSGNVSLI